MNTPQEANTHVQKCTNILLNYLGSSLVVRSLGHSSLQRLVATPLALAATPYSGYPNNQAGKPNKIGFSIKNGLKPEAGNDREMLVPKTMVDESEPSSVLIIITMTVIGNHEQLPANTNNVHQQLLSIVISTTSSFIKAHDQLPSSNHGY